MYKVAFHLNCMAVFDPEPLLQPDSRIPQFPNLNDELGLLFKESAVRVGICPEAAVYEAICELIDRIGGEPWVDEYQIKITPAPPHQKVTHNWQTFYRPRICVEFHNAVPFRKLRNDVVGDPKACPIFMEFIDEMFNYDISEFMAQTNKPDWQLIDGKSELLSILVHFMVYTWSVERAPVNVFPDCTDLNATMDAVLDSLSFRIGLARDIQTLRESWPTGTDYSGYIEDFGKRLRTVHDLVSTLREAHSPCYPRLNMRQY